MNTRHRRLGLVLLPAMVMSMWPGALPAASAGEPQTTDVWIELDLPALASLPRQNTAERQALRLRIVQQQDTVMAQLRRLGAQERGRVQLLRNALAVRLPRDQLDEARRLPGVHGVRPVRDVRRPPPSSKD
jgi:hypothetical protein